MQIHSQPLLDIVIPSTIAFLVASWRGRTITTNPVHAALCATVGMFAHKAIWKISGLVHDLAVKKIYTKYKENPLLLRTVAYSIATISTLSLGLIAKRTESSFELFSGWIISALYVNLRIMFWACNCHEKTNFAMGLDQNLYPQRFWI